MKTHFSIFLQIFVVILIAENTRAAIAPSIKTCPRNSPNLAECLIKAVDVMKPQISTGYYGPNLISDVNLTRVLIGDIAVNRNINVKLLGMYIVGMNNFKIEKLRINPEKFKIEIIVSIPHMDGFAKYSLGWNLGIFAIQGAGDENFSLDNTKVLMKLSGTRYPRNGVEYLKIDSAEMTIKSGNLRVYFDNLFNGQKALEKAANEVINQNIELFKGEVFPPIEQNLSKILLRLATQIFDSAPYEEFFPIK
ncbi:hypothetical protein ACKWTF_009105 [Chironomus riparius]